jgi:hypothetical protein
METQLGKERKKKKKEKRREREIKEEGWEGSSSLKLNPQLFPERTQSETVRIGEREP